MSPNQVSPTACHRLEDDRHWRYKASSIVKLEKQKQLMGSEGKPVIRERMQALHTWKPGILSLNSIEISQMHVSVLKVRCSWRDGGRRGSGLKFPRRFHCHHVMARDQSI